LLLRVTYEVNQMKVLFKRFISLVIRTGEYLDKPYENHYGRLIWVIGRAGANLSAHQRICQQR
jgi:hypothetical protein